MTCEKMVSGILPYMDGRLHKNGRAEMERHLLKCASCKLRLEEFRAVTGLLDRLPVIEPSPEFDVRVRALVAGEPVSRNWWQWLKVSPRVVLAASILFLVILWLGFYRHPGVPASPWSDPQVADEQMMQDLPVLEDHDLLSNFEPLKELSSSSQAESASDTQHPTELEERTSNQ